LCVLLKFGLSLLVKLNCICTSNAVWKFKFFLLLCPCGYLYFYYFSIMNQNWVQELILAWLWPHFHLVFWMKQDLTPQPFDCEPSSLTTRPDCMLCASVIWAKELVKLILEWCERRRKNFIIVRLTFLSTFFGGFLYLQVNQNPML